MTSLVEALPVLIPLAVRWAKAQEAEACRVGRALHARERELAAGVGVAHPELIRIVEVTHFPFPDHPLLAEAAQRGGLLGPNTAGLTLGYAVFVLRGKTGDLALLSHEFRHVQQCEQLGAIDGFLPEYLRQIVEFGYFDAPLERDARAYEWGQV